MKVYHLRKEKLVPAPLEKVWQFFSDPGNLKLLTPPYMNFRIENYPDTDIIFEDMIIEYKVSPVLGIPVKWVTRIESVSINNSFKDIQIEGPFALWEHTHTFEERENNTFMTDHLKYAPPFGILGQLANSLFLRKQLQDIFTFREEVIGNIFPE